MSDLNKAQIKNLITNWANAVRKGDLQGVIAYHSDDIVMFDVAQPLQIKGINSYKNVWSPFFSYLGNDGKFDLSEVKITENDTVAFCHALLTVGKEEKPEVRLTMGLEKIGGKWIITHEHHSAPIEE